MPQAHLKKWVLGTVAGSFVSVSIILGFYNLYLQGAERHNIMGLTQEYDRLAVSMDALKDQIEQERQARLRAAQSVDHLMDNLSRYQDSMASIQTELVKLRYNMDALQKMPQFEVSRRMEALNLLATDVSVEYARQKLLLSHNFDAAIEQLKQARERVALSEGNQKALLEVLDTGVEQLEKLQIAYRDLRIEDRLDSLKQKIPDLSFKKILHSQTETLKQQEAESSQAALGHSVAQYLQHSWLELKSAFVLKKGQQVDMTTLSKEGEERFLDHLKILLDRSKEAYDLGDTKWYQHQLSSLDVLCRAQLDQANQKVKDWMEELDALSQETIGINESSINPIFDAIKQALAQIYEHPQMVGQNSNQAPAQVGQEK